MTSDLSVRRRLHPAEIVLAALDNLRELLIAAVAGFVVGGGPGGLGAPLALLLGLAGVAFVLLIGYLRWNTTVYWVSGGALHLRQGIVSPDETSIPIARVQAIETTQGPV